METLVLVGIRVVVIAVLVTILVIINVSEVYVTVMATAVVKGNSSINSSSGL